MDMQDLLKLRDDIDAVNLAVLTLLNQRAALVEQIGKVKEALGIPRFDPSRESEQLQGLVVHNPGPLRDDLVKHIFKEIFKLSLDVMEHQAKKQLLVHRQGRENTIVTVGNTKIGEGEPPIIIAGPCSIESYEQFDAIAKHLAAKGVTYIRGGVFKPRTSPYAFQGLGLKGLPLIYEITRKYNLLSVSEVLDPRHIEAAFEYIDVFQVGARNMHNYELLKTLGEIDKPILLKRGFMSTLEEFLLSAEYILARGNKNIILCERGIRTFEPWTRNTLDISAIPILHQETHLPVIVDISHSTGRKDIAIPIAIAALAAGSNGIMVEVHNDPETAQSDSQQQLNFDQFDILLEKFHSVAG